MHTLILFALIYVPSRSLCLGEILHEADFVGENNILAFLEFLLKRLNGVIIGNLVSAWRNHCGAFVEETYCRRLDVEADNVFLIVFDCEFQVIVDEIFVCAINFDLFDETQTN